MVSHHLTECILSIVFLLVTYYPTNYAQVEDNTGPEVTISQGTLLGRTLTTRNGRNVFAFLGIPYGEPPTGNLRFASPVAANGWNGTLNATVDPTKCSHILSDVVVGEEDCLFVKVYTPQLPQNANSSLLPVMVYIHGGGFASEDPDYNSPEYLLDADVVLVVLNYRLGPLGFLSTGDEVASGNWGLKDQVLALEWVQNNVRYFGGDPDQVTIFGESAGAASIHLLSLSNATIGLFHRYITQSGSALAAWAYRPRAAYSSWAFELGEIVGCYNDTTDSLVSCLRTVDASEIVAFQLLFSSMMVWGPTDEPDVEGAILTDSPTNLLAAGKIRDLPWISGIVRDEGLLFTAAWYEDEETLHAFLENFDTTLPGMLNWDYQPDLWDSRIKAVKAYYFDNDLTSNRSDLLKNLTMLCGDSHFYYPAYNALQKQHALAANPQYFYTFDYQGTFSYTFMDVGRAVSYGVKHADDLIYLFPKEEVFSAYNKTMTETDYQMVDTMVQLWTSFAINGTPTASALVNNGMTWEPYSSQDNYLGIGNESDAALEVQYSFFKERMEFWANIDAVVDTEDNSETATEPEVTIPKGTVLGTTMTTRHGRSISAFLGIPYGQPPTGNLRFASPVAADGWNGTLNATVDPTKCSHILSDVVVGEEDCLFVKVYTPQNDNSSLLPVMVYIHGGGFAGESPDRNGPGYLLDADVVLVVLNYRLGPLGFLSTGDEVASGNWGLKDQVLALEWVQDNVRYFGGDPDQVTIFGESAGAVSVHLLSLSNATIGLFHRYITQSGSALAAWAHRPRAAYSSWAFELGEIVGCNNDTTDSLVSCLRTVDSSEIIASQLLSSPIMVWGPTDEPDVEGAILTDSPTNLLAAGKIRDLPWISGIVRDEGLLFTEAWYEDEETLHAFLENFDTNLPGMLNWDYQPDLWDSRVKAVKAYYFNDDLTSNTSDLLKNLTMLCGDSHFYYPAYNALQKQHALAANPQYFYTFDYQGTFSYTFMDVGRAVSYGVRHADDLIYLFPKEEVFSAYNKTMTEADYQMVATMVQLWTSFAINGTPTASALVNNGMTWEPYSSQDNYLGIGNESDAALEVQYSFFKERMEFWANIDAVVDTEDNSETATEPEVTIPKGTVLGTTMTTRHGRSISAFLGIPYGQPPTGNLRFASPVAADGWNGTLNATVDPTKCSHILSDVVVGEEDCLFVKVYTPQLPQNDNSSLLPVMVYIHGGGFAGESPDRNGPGYLLDADVVLVVLNYRLGPLGFLSTGDEVASGNWGLKDQVLALEWVQDNVRYFGGDPDQVTIFGESAGAVSVHLLSLSNATIGLFHRYITQSGSALAAWAHRPRAAYSSWAFELGEIVGCNNDTTDSLVSCLRTVDSSEIIASQLLSSPIMVWGPTDEPDVEGAILTDSPTNLLAAGKIRDLPWISGIVRDEGLLFTEAWYEDEETLHAFLENFDTNLPGMLNWDYQPDLWDSRVKAVKAYYFNDDLTSNTSDLLKNLTMLCGDSHFYYPAYNALQKQHALAANPQYFYTFDYQGTFSYTFMDVGRAVSYGVRHADDLIYLFPKEEVFSAYNKTMTEADYQMVATMVQLWTSFAINGTPTAPALSGSTTWEPYSTELDNYLRIGNDSDVSLELQYSFFEERMQFWATIDDAEETNADSGTATLAPNLIFLVLVPCSKFFLSAATAHESE